jgi:hypothetical protein
MERMNMKSKSLIAARSDTVEPTWVFGEILRVRVETNHKPAVVVLEQGGQPARSRLWTWLYAPLLP